MEYAAAIFVLLVCNIGIGLLFVWRELPSRRAKLEFDRARHTATIRAAWDQKRAEDDLRIALAKHKAQDRSQRLREREEKRSARSQFLIEHNLRKKIRQSKMDERQVSRERRIASKNKPGAGKD